MASDLHEPHRESHELNDMSEGNNAQETIRLEVYGMHCAGCAARVEKALRGVPGVKAAEVALVSNQAQVTVESGVELEPQKLTRAVSGAGYQASVIDTRRRETGEMFLRLEAETLAWKSRFFVAVLVLVLLVILTYGVPLPTSGLLVAQLILAGMVQFWVGYPYLVGAARSARHLGMNMDTLIALGTLTAYGAGVAELVMHFTGSAHVLSWHGKMYFVDAAMIITFITLGKYLESHARGKTTDAIRGLIDLAPPEANVIRAGQTSAVPVEQVAVDETIVVRPGQRVPLDAVVVDGQSEVDQSWLTGESVPVAKAPGDTILAGTVNGAGALTARVTRAEDDTTLAWVVRLVEQAQASKPPIARLADGVVAWFVPVVLAIAAAALLAWGVPGGDWATGLRSAVAVLVVACPCALGLATPTAIVVAGGSAARHGILVKNGVALETVAEVSSIVFDKTGTLTLGKPSVVEVLPSEDVSETELLGAVATAETAATHPLAEAIVAYARSRGVPIEPVTRLEVVPGRGIVTQWKGQQLAVGNGALIEENAPGAAVETRNPGEGRMVVHAAVDQRYLGRLVLEDQIAETSQEALEQLRRFGMKLVMLTGDRREVAQRVAESLGISEVIAEVTPQQKHDVVARLQRRGEKVAMVGDGINDAAALAAADVGIAIGAGADIAVESADVVLVEGDLGRMVQLVMLSRSTLRIIKQNLGWAFVYNLLLLPVAAGALIPVSGFALPPAAAAAAMAASSVSVVTNSLRLRGILDR